jgi:U2 small nuclear ribonucleoprotein A'
MRLTVELIQQSPQFLNPVNDRELDLRGHKIAAIENLGVTRDSFDTIDLSDNEIRRLDNLPQMNRLKNLIINNNRLESIEPNLGSKLPSLESLIMSKNNFRESEPLGDALKHFRKLHSLSLMDNPVTKKEHYRLYIIYHVPSLKFLDFIKVKRQEREQAQKLFKQGIYTRAGGQISPTQ